MPVLEGIAQFCYTKDLPSDAIAIASLYSTLTTPADLVDVLNSGTTAPLDVRLISTLDSSPADFTCPDYNQPITISGSTEYKVDNQFFQLSNQLDANGNYMWYIHILPAGISATILDLSGNIITDSYIIVGNNLYHDLADKPYQVEYTDAFGYIHTNILKTNLIMAPSRFTAGPTSYVLLGRQLQVGTSGNLYIQFTKPDGYLTSIPWTNQPNNPWYMRIRFPLNPYLPEYSNQVFLPSRPYLLASYVPGVIFPQNIIQFQRPNIYVNPNQLPNILIFNSDFTIKHAIDGSQPGTQSNLGDQYNWQQGLIYDIDYPSATVQLSVDIGPTDIAYGFYSYVEPDYILRSIDVNPFTNPLVRNRYINFYTKSTNPNPLINVFYQVVDPITGPISGATNDTGGGVTNLPFSTVTVGADVSPSSFTITDIRTRGGGLSPANQNDPAATSCWDLGFWDGKPYPVTGAVMIYAPASLLNTLTRTNIQASIQAVLPAGVFPVVRFYNPDGTELV
jgi:hypothetical protein